MICEAGRCPRDRASPVRVTVRTWCVITFSARLPITPAKTDDAMQSSGTKIFRFTNASWGLGLEGGEISQVVLEKISQVDMQIRVSIGKSRALSRLNRARL